MLDRLRTTWEMLGRDIIVGERYERNLKSIRDLQCEYLDMLFIHWPFPNYHAPFCDVNSRNPDSKPFSVE